MKSINSVRHSEETMKKIVLLLFAFTVYAGWDIGAYHDGGWDIGAYQHAEEDVGCDSNLVGITKLDTTATTASVTDSVYCGSGKMLLQLGSSSAVVDSSDSLNSPCRDTLIATGLSPSTKDSLRIIFRDTGSIFDTTIWIIFYTADSTDTAEIPHNTAPTITTQPASDSVRFGQSCTLTVVASGTDTLSYQWQYYSDGWQDSGSTDSDTFIVASPDTGVYNYRVIVTNDFGADTSDCAEITVYWPQFTVDTNIVGTGTLALSPEGLTQDSSTVITFTGTAGDGYTGDTSFTITLVSDTACTVTFLQYPVIDSIRPDPWYYGKRISIYGTGFLTPQGTGFIVLENDTLTDVESWSNTQIVDTIPADMTRGMKYLQIQNSNNLIRGSDDSLRVLRPYAR